MQDYIQRRVLEICAYILETRATVRQAAKVFSVSKSTVHKDMTERLPSLNRLLARKIRAILEQNKAERHLRGGEATRRKYRERIEKEEREELIRT
ncbi:sporulation transcriptional regulator SpoIIID [Desulfothermobacter acidiphilus]|uniref:sporulation transcriptional regulator SpoIIID n=1 Tax=Desulfothermobacter acidiphilus TaxID=1938353 RepID=UPI003F8AC148